MESQRLDKWLWAARFFKTRSLATEAINGGKVHVDGQRIKPARTIRPGMLVRVRKRDFEISVAVTGLSKQRGPATQAQTLYQETPESAVQRQQASTQRKLQAAGRSGTAGRPSKRDRRQIHRFRNRNSESA